MNIKNCCRCTSGKEYIHCGCDCHDIKENNVTLLTDAEWDRMNELYENAVARYLDKTDFNVSDWLSDKDAEEYCNLVDKEQGE